MDETAFHNVMCNVTHTLFVIGKDVITLKMWNAKHWLLVIGKDVIRLLSQDVQWCHSLGYRSLKDVMGMPFIKHAMSLTGCCSQETMWSDHLSQTCNVTHLLLVIEKMWWDCPSQNVQCHSLSVSHRKWCAQSAFHKMCNITDSLLVIGNVVMRLSFTKCAMSLTSCWL